MRISDWSSDVCSSDLTRSARPAWSATCSWCCAATAQRSRSSTPARCTEDATVGDVNLAAIVFALSSLPAFAIARMLRREPKGAPRSASKEGLDRRIAWLMETAGVIGLARSEEHAAELQALSRTSSSDLCL